MRRHARPDQARLGPFCIIFHFCLFTFFFYSVAISCMEFVSRASANPFHSVEVSAGKKDLNGKQTKQAPSLKECRIYMIDTKHTPETSNQSLCFPVYFL
jgi:hypothetical protein